MRFFATGTPDGNTLHVDQRVTFDLDDTRLELALWLTLLKALGVRR